MVWKIVFRKRFDSDLDRLRDTRGTDFDIEGLKYAFTFLAEGTPLPGVFGDHALVDDWAHRREFHLSDDDLIVYQSKPRVQEIVLMRAGTHEKLFRKRVKHKKK